MGRRKLPINLNEKLLSDKAVQQILNENKRKFAENPAR
jgi:hypothetical protein